MRYVVLKKGGEPGEVAINPQLVTHIRSMPGPYTDIYFGPHRVAVEGTLQQVLERLNGVSPATPRPEGWINPQG